MKHHNHEVWTTCPNCGTIFDLRRYAHCPGCGREFAPFKYTATTQKGTYNRKYYLHRRIKAAGFDLQLEETHKTIVVTTAQVEKAKTNKYVAELKNQHSYGVQILNPMMNPISHRETQKSKTMTDLVTITRIDLREVAATWALFEAIDHRYLAYASRRIRLRNRRKGGQR